MDSAAQRVGDLNPLVKLVKHEELLTAENALRILGDYDIVVDGSDNFPTRYLVNDACVLLGLPLVYGMSPAAAHIPRQRRGASSHDGSSTRTPLEHARHTSEPRIGAYRDQLRCLDHS